MGAQPADTYAAVYPHWYSRFLSSGDTVSQQQVEPARAPADAAAQPAIRRQPDDLQFFEQQVGQQMVQQQVLLAEADKLGIQATDDDVAHFLHTGPIGEVLFPNGQFIGDDHYAD